MQCSECKQRPATLHYTQIINGKKTEIHVCEVCAAQMGYPLYQTQDDPFSLQDLLTSLFHANHAKMDMHNSAFFEQIGQLECDRCHSTFADFQRLGKFGCAHCYQSFRPKLDAIFRRVHSGNAKHHGKIPKRKGGKLHIKKEIEMYREYLQQLVAEENFEQAAIVRDKIKELEEQQRGESS